MVPALFIILSLCFFISFCFWVVDTQLYKRLCPSVCPSIGPLVRPSVCPSVRPLYRPSWWSSWKVGKRAFWKLFVYVWVLRVGWGVDWGWMPLPTRPQRYCDPTSLVWVLYLMSNLGCFCWLRVCFSWRPKMRFFPLNARELAKWVREPMNGASMLSAAELSDASEQT